jgi:hypothetical protein
VLVQVQVQVQVLVLLVPDFIAGLLMRLRHTRMVTIHTNQGTILQCTTATRNITTTMRTINQGRMKHIVVGHNQLFGTALRDVLRRSRKVVFILSKAGLRGIFKRCSQSICVQGIYPDTFTQINRDRE